MHKHISIITVCYNCKSSIKDTCISVISQSYKDFEYIIVDGGSTDGTTAILTEIKNIAFDKNISIQIFSEKDKGVYDAMNKGARLAKGDYVLYMNAGDTFYSNEALSNLCDGLSANVDVLFGDTMMLFNWGKILNKPGVPSIDDPMPFIHQSCLTRKSLLIHNPFDLNYKIIADHNLFYQLIVKDAKFKYVSTTVAEYDAREGISAENPYRQYVEYAKIHGYDKQWWYPLRQLYYLLRFGLQMRIKQILPQKINDSIERKRREKRFNTSSNP